MCDQHDDLLWSADVAESEHVLVVPDGADEFVPVALHGGHGGVEIVHFGCDAAQPGLAGRRGVRAVFVGGVVEPCWFDAGAVAGGAERDHFDPGAVDADDVLQPAALCDLWIAVRFESKGFEERRRRAGRAP